MDADDGASTKFTNPISEEMDADEAAAAAEIDPTADAGEDGEGEKTEIDEAAGKKKPKTKIKKDKYVAPVQEDLMGDLDNTTDDVDMDPLSLLKGFLSRWGKMSCGERVGEVKTVRSPPLVPKA